MITSTYKREKKAKKQTQSFKAWSILFILIGLAMLTGTVLGSFEKPVYAIEVDNRDYIQKVTDNLAEAYRVGDMELIYEAEGHYNLFVSGI